MKIITSLLLVSLTMFAQAEAFFGGDVQLGVDKNHQKNVRENVRAEYWWGAGDFSGYGYQDVYNLGSETARIADHRLRYHFSGKLFVASETRFSTFGDSQKFGVGIQLAKTQNLDSIFDKLNVTYYGFESGSGDSKQLLTVWSTKSLQLSNSVRVYATGISRIRQDAPDFHEPQLWFSVNENPLEVGVEVNIFDGVYTPQITMKYSF